MAAHDSDEDIACGNMLSKANARTVLKNDVRCEAVLVLDIFTPMPAD